MRFPTVVLGVVVLSGCGVSLYQTSPYEPVAGPVPIARGTASDFSALVPPSDGPTRCEVRDGDASSAASRWVTLASDGRPTQRITVMLDERGAPARYVDDRREEPDGDDGDRTTIALYLTGGYAVVANRSEGTLDVLEIPLDEAAEAPGLGHPSETLERVLARCGG